MTVLIKKFRHLVARLAVTGLVGSSGAAVSGSTLLLGSLLDKGFVNVGDDTTTSDGGLNEGIQLLVTTDGELKMAGSNTLHLKILGSVTGQLKNLSSKVLKDSGRVHSGGGTNTLLKSHTLLQETVDTTDGKLMPRN